MKLRATTLPRDKDLGISVSRPEGDFADRQPGSCSARLTGGETVTEGQEECGPNGPHIAVTTAANAFHRDLTSDPEHSVSAAVAELLGLAKSLEVLERDLRGDESTCCPDPSAARRYLATRKALDRCACRLSRLPIASLSDLQQLLTGAGAYLALDDEPGPRRDIVRAVLRASARLLPRREARRSADGPTGPFSWFLDSWFPRNR